MSRLSSDDDDDGDGGGGMDLEMEPMRVGRSDSDEALSPAASTAAAVRRRWLYGSACLLAFVIVLAVVVMAPFKSIDDPSADGSGGGKPWDELRLPPHTRPRLYDLQIGADFAAATFQGTVGIDVELLGNGPERSSLHLHAVSMAIKGVLWSGDEKVVGHELMSKNEFLVVHFDRPLQLGTTRRLTVTFQGALTDSLKGFYLSTYTDKTGAVKKVATTQFEATDARRAFPCFDEPSFKANFTVALVTEPGRVAVSNMPVVSVDVTSEPGKHIHHFMTSPVMASYLVAFIDCDFARITNATDAGVVVSVLTPPDEIHMAAFALETGRRVLSAYRAFFGVAFPLPKLDMVAIPDFAAGAMENWGCVTYRQADLLYQEGTSSTAMKQRVAVVIAHELAHQIFGDLTTMVWWDALFLNEGFASFVEHLGVQTLHPDWRMWEQFVFTQQEALRLDALAGSHPIDVEVTTPQQISEIFDSISYNKGASVIAMMRMFLGDSDFQTGLHRYVRTHMYGNTETADLWAAMDAELRSLGHQLDEGLTVQRVMDSWTRQKGYPVVTVALDQGVVRLTQQHFTLKGPQDTTTRWFVPIKYKKGGAGGEEAMVWLTDAPTDVVEVAFDAGADQWVWPNRGQKGFYRVHFTDQGLWRQLFAQLPGTTLDPVDKAGIVSDAMFMARGGSFSSYEMALEMTLHLADVDDYIVWRTALDEFSWLQHRLRTRVWYGDLERHVRALVLSATRKAGHVTPWRLGSDAGLSFLERRFTSMMTAAAVAYGDWNTTLAARAEFEALRGGGVRINPDVWATVLEVGVAHGGALQWEYVWSLYGSATVSQKRDILFALSQAREPWLLKRYLTYALDSNKIRRQDGAYVLAYVSGYNAIGQDVVWEFFQENWERLLALSEGFGTARIIRSSCQNFASRSKLAEVRRFFKEGPAVGQWTEVVDQVLEEIEGNVKWLEEHAPSIETWLAANKNQ